MRYPIAAASIVFIVAGGPRCPPNPWRSIQGRKPAVHRQPFAMSSDWSISVLKRAVS